MRIRFLYVQHGETKDVLEGVKITVAVQQRMSFSETERRNEAIHRLTHSITALSQHSEIPRSRNCELGASACEYLVLNKFPEYAIERTLVRYTLQYFAENYVNQAQTLPYELCVQPVHLGISDAA